MHVGFSTINFNNQKEKKHVQCSIPTCWKINTHTTAPANKLPRIPAASWFRPQPVRSWEASAGNRFGGAKFGCLPWSTFCWVVRCGHPPQQYTPRQTFQSNHNNVWCSFVVCSLEVQGNCHVFQPKKAKMMILVTIWISISAQFVLANLSNTKMLNTNYAQTHRALIEFAILLLLSFSTVRTNSWWFSGLLLILVVNGQWFSWLAIMVNT